MQKMNETRNLQLSQEEILSLFRAADVDYSGAISYQEFRQLVCRRRGQALHPGVPEAEDRAPLAAWQPVGLGRRPGPPHDLSERAGARRAPHDRHPLPSPFIRSRDAGPADV